MRMLRGRSLVAHEDEPEIETYWAVKALVGTMCSSAGLSKTSITTASFIFALSLFPPFSIRASFIDDVERNIHPPFQRPLAAQPAIRGVTKRRKRTTASPKAYWKSRATAAFPAQREREPCQVVFVRVR